MYYKLFQPIDENDPIDPGINSQIFVHCTHESMAILSHEDQKLGRVNEK